MLAPGPAQSVVHAVVVTYNRRELLADCLGALAGQTYPVRHVLVVDNASTDDSEAYVRARLPHGLHVEWLRMARNGGGAEGFHAGVAHAREGDADWLWLMDDDCVPPPTCLDDLLASPKSADPETAALAPLVVTPEGDSMPLNRGWLRPRWFRSPLVGLSPEHDAGAEVAIDFASLVGPLVRSDAARATDPPRREFFIWFDDLEWMLRLGQVGRVWLVPSAKIVHKDVRQLSSLSFLALVREFARGYPFEARWKRIYGLRNMIWTGRRHGFMSLPRAVAFAGASLVRGLLFESHRRRTLVLVARFAADGWHGRFRNLPPARWPELADHPRPLRHLDAASLRYEEPVRRETRRLDAAPPTPAACG